MVAKCLVACVAFGLVSSLANGAEPHSEAAVVGLDHIPIAVGNLERAAADFQRLGFVLKPGRYHENGIRNQHVKFRDGTELELITAGAARDSLTSTYLKHLTSGDGPAFLAFYAPNAGVLTGQLESVAQPFRIDGGLVSLTEPPNLRFIFFAQRNQSPTDRPEHFEHPNSAESLIGVWLAADDAPAPRALWAALGAKVAEATVDVPRRESRLVARFAEGEVTMLPSSRQLVAGRPIVGAVLRTRNLDDLRRVVEKSQIEIAHVIESPGQRSLFIAPNYAHGLWLEFREKRSE